MPVNFVPIQEKTLYPIKGLQLGYAEAGIKKPGRKDLLLITLAPGSEVAGVFTQNRFCAAPVQVCQQRLSQSSQMRALVINTGNANAGTGPQGLKDAQNTTLEVSKLLGIQDQEVLPFSTGVILEPLPIQKILDALPQAIKNLTEDGWFNAAYAIMTTDTLPKAHSIKGVADGKAFHVTGISKGAGI